MEDAILLTAFRTGAVFTDTDLKKVIGPKIEAPSRHKLQLASL
jgi:hypothetical protein